jgi:DNA-binding MarR family transcriptional regulator
LTGVENAVKQSSQAVSMRTPPTRDLVDNIVALWRREMPGLVRPEYELAQRVARLSVLLQDSLAVTLVLWDLNRTDYAVLNMLRSMGSPYKLRPTDLKVRLLLTSGGVTSVLKRLEQRGFVERGQDTTDVRSCWVPLTQVGIETASATQSWSQAESQFFSAVAPEAVQAASDATARSPDSYRRRTADTIRPHALVSPRPHIHLTVHRVTVYEAARSARKYTGIQRADSNDCMALAGTGRDGRNPCTR